MIARLAKRLVSLALCAVFATAALIAPAPAASPFETVARVDNAVITRYELEQRQLLLTVLGIPGSDRDSVLQALIEDRLKMAAVQQFKVEADVERLQQALEDFAGRAQLDAAGLLAALGQEGIAPETVRAYVEVATNWGNLVRGRFARNARVSDEELDRALALGTGGSNIQVLLSEIVLPMTPDKARISAQQADIIGQMTGFEEFASAARQVSVAPTGPNGGQLDWLPLSQLPPQIAPIFLSMTPGEVSAPVTLANGQAIGLFQFRALKDARPSISRDMDLTYMTVRLSGPGQASAELARIAPLVEDCDSLYGLYPGVSEAALFETTAARSDLGDTARLFDTLDPGELAPLPGGAAFVMLCNRVPHLSADISRDDLQRRLFSRNLEDLANSYLAELRANAYIEFE